MISLESTALGWFLRPGARAAILTSLLAVCPLGKAEELTGTLNRFEFEEPQMGVPFRIVLYAPDSGRAEAAAQAAFRRVAQLNDSMSDYETDSELNELSRTSGKGLSTPVSGDLWTVLQRAQGFSELSDGAFDITVGPVVSLWRKARRTRQLPEADRLREALRAVGYRNLRLNAKDHTAELMVPGMKLDLGGIAKGYALDQEIKVLTAQGINRALVTGGGDMAMSDPPPGQTGWRIEIAPLDVTNAPPKRFARLARTGLATSGDLFQHLEFDGKRYSHVVDPRTGIGLTDHSLVTVIAPDCTTADALAKVVGVLGPQKGFKVIRNVPGVEAHAVRKPNEHIELEQTPGFDRFCEKP